MESYFKGMVSERVKTQRTNTGGRGQLLPRVRLWRGHVRGQRRQTPGPGHSRCVGRKAGSGASQAPHLCYCQNFTEGNTVFLKRALTQVWFFSLIKSV